MRRFGMFAKAVDRVDAGAPEVVDIDDNPEFVHDR